MLLRKGIPRNIADELETLSETGLLFRWLLVV